ncbi:MAG: hypothetical protein ACKO25_04320, partial [Cyanobium sp.]
MAEAMGASVVDRMPLSGETLNFLTVHEQVMIRGGSLGAEGTNQGETAFLIPSDDRIVRMVHRQQAHPLRLINRNPQGLHGMMDPVTTPGHRGFRIQGPGRAQGGMFSGQVLLIHPGIRHVVKQGVWIPPGAGGQKRIGLSARKSKAGVGLHP